MELSAIKTHILSLPTIERDLFIRELTTSIEGLDSSKLSRRELLNNKQGSCPHCGYLKYVKYGFKSGSQRYKCKSCTKSFTEYTGTWIAGLHKKEIVLDYLSLLYDEKSLDYITETLSINKKTVFDWRHKILSSFTTIEKEVFTGITESDETFFLFSEKGQTVKERTSRHRGGSSSKRGINNEHVAVIVTMDRDNELDLTLATTGRISKKDIENAIGEQCTNQTVLCSDGHRSYRAFAETRELEHHTIPSSKKENSKKQGYHIQHVNATHNKIKKWLDNTFWGVSTKYLQQYLNWFRIKEKLKSSANKFNDFITKSILDVTTYHRYKEINNRYLDFINTNLN